MVSGPKGHPSAPSTSPVPSKNPLRHTRAAAPIASQIFSIWSGVQDREAAGEAGGRRPSLTPGPDREDPQRTGRRPTPTPKTPSYREHHADPRLHRRPPPQDRNGDARLRVTAVSSKRRRDPPGPARRQPRDGHRSPGSSTRRTAGDGSGTGGEGGDRVDIMVDRLASAGATSPMVYPNGIARSTWTSRSAAPGARAKAYVADDESAMSAGSAWTSSRRWTRSSRRGSTPLSPTRSRPGSSHPAPSGRQPDARNRLSRTFMSSATRFLPAGTTG